MSAAQRTIELSGLEIACGTPFGGDPPAAKPPEPRPLSPLEAAVEPAVRGRG
jgi:hypothetical protein